jgi:hypothetical protein
LKCTKCGREIPDNTLFCSYCGNRVGPDWGIGPGTQEGAPKQKASEVLVLVVVLVVVAVVIAGIFITVVVMNEVGKEITTSDVEITVLSSGTPASYIFPPDTGKKYVQLTVLLSNNEDTSITLSSFEFQLEVVGGARYYSTWNVDDTVPASVSAGGSATFTIAFEIPDTAVPQKLIYKPLFGNEVDAPVP